MTANIERKSTLCTQEIRYLPPYLAAKITNWEFFGRITLAFIPENQNGNSRVFRVTDTLQIIDTPLKLSAETLISVKRNRPLSIKISKISCHFDDQKSW